MVRTALITLTLAILCFCSTLFAQDSSTPAPTDLKVELRSATGSKRFQLGEVIPLEVLISSSTPERYLEPCKLFWESCFGYPQSVEGGAETRIASNKLSHDDLLLYSLDGRLLEAYATAQGWMLSPEDALKLRELVGEKKTNGVACRFSCGSPISVAPAPGSYYIYGRVHDPIFPSEALVDYLMPTEPFQYSVNQYTCGDLKTLEQKLLQFPAGTTFSFANTGSGRDQGDWADIANFLRKHGYSVRN